MCCCWWCGVLLLLRLLPLMGALRSAHLTVGQVSCMINGIHIRARYFAACIAKAAVAVAIAISSTARTTARVFTSPIGRILFGQRQRRCRKELGGQQSRRRIQQRCTSLYTTASMMMMLRRMTTHVAHVWLMRIGHYGLVWYGSKL